MPGNLHISGRCVQYAFSKGGRFGDPDEPAKRDHKKRTYSMNRKNKQRVFDACTYQNHVASMDCKLSHCFFTLTYGDDPEDNANIHVGLFLEKLMKHAKRVYPEIGQKASYVWVREQTEKGRDHFHVIAVLPVFTIPKAERKNKSITYSIPFYYDGEETGKYFSLNKAWCQTRGGEYSKNAVRVSKVPKYDQSGKIVRNERGRVVYSNKSKFVIDDLFSAIRYVAKYTSKGQKDKDGNIITSTKPVMRFSKNLTEWTKPLKMDDVLGFCFHPYYGGNFEFWEDGEIVRTEKILETDYAKVGKVKIDRAAKLYLDVLQYQTEKQLENLEKLAKLKKANQRLKRITEEKRKQLQIE